MCLANRIESIQMDFYFENSQTNFFEILTNRIVMLTTPPDRPPPELIYDDVVEKSRRQVI